MNAIADNRPNAIATHLAGGVGDDPTPVIKHDAEPAVRQNLVNDTFDGEQFFFGHKAIVFLPEVPLDRRIARGAENQGPCCLML